MTGTTHQMIALLAAFWVLTAYPLLLGPTLGTLAVITVMVGALTPDLDQPTANLWRRLLAGRALGNIFQVFSGGHRHFTHSLLGIAVVGWLVRWALIHVVHPELLPGALVLWCAFMIGYVSHPFADTLTDRGVPWLWPLPWHIKIPPGPPQLRVTTGSIVERIIIRGGLLVIALLLLQTYWHTLLSLFHSTSL